MKAQNKPCGTVEYVFVPGEISTVEIAADLSKNSMHYKPNDKLVAEAIAKSEELGIPDREIGERTMRLNGAVVYVYPPVVYEKLFTKNPDLTVAQQDRFKEIQYKHSVENMKARVGRFSGIFTGMYDLLLDTAAERDKAEKISNKKESEVVIDSFLDALIGAEEYMVKSEKIIDSSKNSTQKLD